MRVLLTMSYNIIMLFIIHTLYAGYIGSVYRMVMENRPVDPGSIQGNHRPIFFMRIKYTTRANDLPQNLWNLSINHIVGLVHKNHIINEIYARPTNESDVPRSLQSWVSTIQSVVLTADVFEKRQLWVQPIEWLKLNFASCVVHQTRSLGVLIRYFIINMVFVN